TLRSKRCGTGLAHCRSPKLSTQPGWRQSKRSSSDRPCTITEALRWERFHLFRSVDIGPVPVFLQQLYAGVLHLFNLNIAHLYWGVLYGFTEVSENPLLRLPDASPRLAACCR